MTLRVGELSNFDLVAERGAGSVKTVGLDLDVVGQEGESSRLRHRAGGRDVRVNASSVVVRAHEEKKRDVLRERSRR